MANLTLVIGNKNYSSWSLRPWILLKAARIPFKEVWIPLHTETFENEIKKYSPSGRVPVLIDGTLAIWESLAICEYVAEQFPEKLLWPEDVRARAAARSIGSEMHAGFQNLRKHFPMNVRLEVPAKSRPKEVDDDIDRITSIWNDCRKRYGKEGSMLFGHFTIADAMFAAIVLRFRTYSIKVDSVSEAYMNSILALPAMSEWIKAAKAEQETIPEYDQLSR